MNISIETFTIFVLLIPGFISKVILDAIIVRTKPSQLFVIIEALIFTFIIYILLSIFTSDVPIYLSKSNNVGKSSIELHYNICSMITMLAISLIIPLIIGYLINHDLHMKLLRRLKITNKTSKNTVWLDVFTDEGKRRIIVHLTDGRRIFGWPLYYSNEPTEGNIYLYKPAWLFSDGEIKKINVHGFFIVKKDYIKAIEFLYNSKKKEKMYE